MRELISNLLAARRRGKVAFQCAMLIRQHLEKTVVRHIDMKLLGEEIPDSEAERAIFWLRALNRYHRLSIGQSPWRRKDFAQD